jgi:hypothetical protein
MCSLAAELVLEPIVKEERGEAAVEADSANSPKFAIFGET